MPLPLIAAGALSLAAEFAPHLIEKFAGKRGSDIAKSVIDVAQSVTGTTAPDAAAEALRADPEKLLAFKVEIGKQELEFAKLDAADRDSARALYKSTGGWTVPVLAWSIIGLFGVVCFGVAWGAYSIITDGIKVRDPGMIAAVSTTIGTIIGYVSAKADQVVSFFFGSSQGSKEKTDAMARSVSDAMSALGKK